MHAEWWQLHVQQLNVRDETHVTGDLNSLGRLHPNKVFSGFQYFVNSIIDFNVIRKHSEESLQSDYYAKDTRASLPEDRSLPCIPKASCIFRRKASLADSFLPVPGQPPEPWGRSFPRYKLNHWQPSDEAQCSQRGC